MEDDNKGNKEAVPAQKPEKREMSPEEKAAISKQLHAARSGGAIMAGKAPKRGLLGLQIDRRKLKN